MIELFFPPPFLKELNPLERLRVYDSLMMNAQRWQKAHNYHRQRQNILYQSLNQPGIVHGLGVHQIEAPREVSSTSKTRPWLEIQPGIAIDWEGNPIIVPKAMTFPVNPPKANTTESFTIYLVVSYRDPETLAYQPEEEILRETFRLDQKTNPPAQGEVELCRFCWQPGNTKLEIPKEVLEPQDNQLDLRYRLQAQTRSLGLIRLAIVTSLAPQKQAHLLSLMKSVSVLYPKLQCASAIEQIKLREQEIAKASQDYHLIYLTAEDLQGLERREIDCLRKYLKAGGVVLVESPFESQESENLKALVREQEKISGQSWEQLSRDHRLRTEPFLFSALPTILEQSIELWHGGGILWVKGELSKAWGVDETLLLPRNDIRTAQEFGINILYYAWRRHQITQLLS